MSTGVQAKLNRVRPRAKNILKACREIGNNPPTKVSALEHVRSKTLQRADENHHPHSVGEDQHEERSRRNEY